MPQQKQPDSISLQPSWKYFFTAYLLSVLAIPLAGIGLIALWFVRRRHRSYRYRITNSRITAVDSKYEHNVDFADVEQVRLQQSGLQRRLGIGTLLLQTSASQMKLLGLEEPSQIREILEQAIAREQQREEQRRETHRKESNYRPGSMEKMEYLTGLWQQGLISEEDYNAERKNFE